MVNLKHFFLNASAFTKNLIYETMPSHEVPAGGSAEHEKEHTNFATQASEAFKTGKLDKLKRVTETKQDDKSTEARSAPEAPLSKAEIRKRAKLLETYVNNTMTILAGRRKNFLEELKKINPNLDVNNENDKKFIDQYFDTYLAKLESEDRENRLQRYISNLPSIRDVEKGHLFAALKQIKSDWDVSEPDDRKFIDLCYQEYSKRTAGAGGVGSVNLLAIVTDLFQKQEALAAREKKRRIPR
jgi:hypothetical protein